MLKKVSYIVMGLLVLSCFTLMSIPAYSQEKIRLKYAGGAEGSGTYRSAVAISELVNKYSKRIEIAVQVSPWSRETPLMLEANMVQLGAGGATGEIWSTQGTGSYKGKPCKTVRRLMIWGASFNLFFAPSKYNINSTDDLVGKKIGIGAKTQPTGRTAANVLKLVGLEGKASWYHNSSASELGERVKDEIITADCMGSRIPGQSCWISLHL